MSSPTPDRRALEELWRKRLEDAKLRLEFARAYLREIEADNPSGDIPASDRVYAREKGYRSERAALEEYKRVLRVYADLMEHGVIPEEREWLQGEAERQRDTSSH